MGVGASSFPRQHHSIIHRLQFQNSADHSFNQTFKCVHREENTDEAVPNQNVAVLSDQLSGTRIFCGALLLPTFSAIFGRLFFESIQNNVHRTLIGGLTFIVIKGAFKIYFKQKQFVRRRQRKIMDYNDDNLMRFSQRDNRSTRQQLAAVGQFL